MGSFKQVLTTIEHWGGCEKEQPKVGPKGEEVGTSESKDTESTEVGGVEFSMLTKQVIQITSQFFAREIIRSMKMYEVFKFK